MVSCPCASSSSSTSSNPEPGDFIVFHLLVVSKFSLAKFILGGTFFKRVIETLLKMSPQRTRKLDAAQGRKAQKHLPRG